MSHSSLLLILGILSLTFFSTGGAFATAKKNRASVTVAETAAPAPNPNQVWVKIEDSSLSCDDPKGLPSIEANRKKLTDLGVKIFETKSSNDGKMRAAMCGIPKGNEDHFLIQKSDLKKAEAKGFQLDPNGSAK